MPPLRAIPAADPPLGRSQSPPGSSVPDFPPCGLESAFRQTPLGGFGTPQVHVRVICLIETIGWEH